MNIEEKIKLIDEKANKTGHQELNRTGKMDTQYSDEKSYVNDLNQKGGLNQSQQQKVQLKSKSQLNFRRQENKLSQSFQK